MKEVIYVSRATAALDMKELFQILQMSRTNNARDHITGMLLYAGDSREFLQVIEGPVDRVDALMNRVRHDPRHESLRVLREGELQRREFGVWDMAFKFFEGTDGLWPAGRLSELDAEQAFAHATSLFRSAVVELRAG